GEDRPVRPHADHVRRPVTNDEVTVNKQRNRLAMVKSTVLALATLALLPWAATPAQEAGAEENRHLVPVHRGIPHDSVYAMDIAGEKGVAVGAFGLILE